MNQIRLQPTAVVLMLAALALGAGRAMAQEAGQAGARRGGGQFAGMQRVNGEVTAVTGATITIKTEDGVTMQVVTTDNTRVMKAQGAPGQGGRAQGGFDANPIKVADLKVGDVLQAAGNLDAPNKTIHAAFVVATDGATVKAFRANLGKTYITGKVTAIDLDNAKMTVERPDKVSQTIAFDETTSFRRGRGGVGAAGRAGGAPQADAQAETESITLADIKVGDNVMGRGVVKSGTFVPTQLTVSTPGQGRRREGGTATPAPASGPGAGPGLN